MDCLRWIATNLTRKRTGTSEFVVWERHSDTVFSWRPIGFNLGWRQVFNWRLRGATGVRETKVFDRKVEIFDRKVEIFDHKAKRWLEIKTAVGDQNGGWRPGVTNGDSYQWFSIIKRSGGWKLNWER